MDPVAQLAAVLVAGDPRGAAERSLSYLMAVHGATAGAVLALKDGELKPYVNRDVGMGTLGEVHRSWGEIEEGLAGGVLVRDETLLLWPIREGGRLTGAVLLEGASAAVSERLFATFGLALAQALQSPSGGESGPRGDEYLQAIRPGDLARQRLLLALQENEWNIAQVARIMGATRRTIYMRMKRYGIPRERVPRSRALVGAMA